MCRGLFLRQRQRLILRPFGQIRMRLGPFQHQLRQHQLRRHPTRRLFDLTRTHLGLLLLRCLASKSLVTSLCGQIRTFLDQLLRRMQILRL
mgnify:CR=1 FL=1